MSGFSPEAIEKIRRYALAALPKIGAGEVEEIEMLSLLREGAQEREKRHLGRALEKVGGVATLDAIEQKGDALPGITQLKVKAAVSRRADLGFLRMDALLPVDGGARIVLRCRTGLESFVRDEAVEVLWPAASARPTPGASCWPVPRGQHAIVWSLQGLAISAGWFVKWSTAPTR